MAEKYGTIPPRFTKEWWSYFWLYYKWHTIITLFILACILTAVYQNITAIKYDLTVAYAGYHSFSDEKAEEISDILSTVCEDVDENGEKNVYFSTLSFMPDNNDPEYNMALYSKLQLNLVADEVYLYIMEESLIDSFIGDIAEYATFEPLENWYKGTVNPETAFSRFETVYGVPVSECKLLKDLDGNFENHYLVLRYSPREDQKNQFAGYEAAKKMAAEIIG